VGQAVEQHGVKPRVTQHDFKHAARGGVAPEDSVDLFADRAEHFSLIIPRITMEA
jgi:hypothetical protein